MVGLFSFLRHGTLEATIARSTALVGPRASCYLSLVAKDCTLYRKRAVEHFPPRNPRPIASPSRPAGSS
jgi:hypothetical protein